LRHGPKSLSPPEKAEMCAFPVGAGDSSPNLRLALLLKSAFISANLWQKKSRSQVRPPRPPCSPVSSVVKNMFSVPIPTWDWKCGVGPPGWGAILACATVPSPSVCPKRQRCMFSWQARGDSSLNLGLGRGHPGSGAADSGTLSQAPRSTETAKCAFSRWGAGGSSPNLSPRACGPRMRMKSPSA
jgi:hypothetical protein